MFGGFARTRGRCRLSLPPPADLLDDVAGPALDFLCHASDLYEFATWAEKIYDGGNRWGAFRPVIPQGTGPLHAAGGAGAR